MKEHPVRSPTIATRVLASASLAACTVNPPLMFGDLATIGLQIGSDAAGSGGSVTLGYKDRSVAIVPLSVLDENGKAWALRAHDREAGDALSVFAVFKSSGQEDAKTVSIGQVFSTGTAAQRLTQGYECYLKQVKCPDLLKPAAPAASAVGTDAAARAARSADSAASSAAQAASSAGAAALYADNARKAAAGAAAASAPDATDRPYQAPLIYTRTDVLGFDIGGSASEQRAVFTLGYTSRNLALVPVYTQHSGQRISKLGGQDGSEVRDAYSVLGQFNGNTKTNALGYGIERYFATGLAALNLGQGLGAAVAAAPAASAASAPPAAAGGNR